MKCLPAAKIPQAQGNVLHDWHAEVLAIRAFNRFVLDECKAMAQGRPSEFLRWRTTDEMDSGCYGNSKSEELEGQTSEWCGQPFSWREDVFIHMYCSEAPCGDASMELIMDAQEDATPWELPPTALSTPLSTSTAEPSPSPSLPGRAYFSHLGVVRRKPARSDAPPTLSKSCSDKLALRQCTSLLASATALLVDPHHAYIRTLVLPASRYSEPACRRSFSASPTRGRMRSLASSTIAAEQGRDPGQNQIQAEKAAESPYRFRPFAVETTTSEFAYSQRTVTNANANANASVSGGNEHGSSSNSSSSSSSKPGAQKAAAASNVSAAWTRSGLEETTLGGILQGRKQSGADARGASFASRRRMWGLAVEVADILLSSRQGEDGEERERKREREGGEERHDDSSGRIAEIKRALEAETYGGMKGCELLEPRRRAKDKARAEALKGWVRNLGDESFTL
ncbi:adenosine deaminase/editase [Daldinia caldariorum]|uniref:adenosine deaminase/editase n=1 Tax=Daldinia caldariorum TaxID=326644 RepID=UPI00200863F1|nr:adenosine deaminase/editase [Daldinia caldariorum]KAI1463691.1 adenosine deaminase/editase [Daldinia caldariorum]